METARAALAAAANTVAGVNASPYFRQGVKAGDALVRAGRTFRDDSGFDYMQTWQVVVFLPADLAEAERLADDLTRPLIDALAGEMVVTEVNREQVQLGSSLLSAVFVEGIRAP